MKQHKTPCAKCPFRRAAAPGWLGGFTPEEFARMAQSDLRMPCHCAVEKGVDYEAAQEQGTVDHEAPQCAGRAIHAANQLKCFSNHELLVLPKDTETVFQWAHEFREHHNKLLRNAK